MSAPVLKKSLGDGGAFIDESNGSHSELRGVLAALARVTGAKVATGVVTPTVAELVAYTAAEPGVLQKFTATVGTTGTANSTALELNVNGTAVATLSFANTEANGTQKSATIKPAIQIEAGDVVAIEATAVATGADGLEAEATIQAVEVE